MSTSQKLLANKILNEVCIFKQIFYLESKYF